MKIDATTLGETSGDLLSMTMGDGYGVSTIFLFTLFLITLIAQLISKGIFQSSIGLLLLQLPSLEQQCLILWIAL